MHTSPREIRKLFLHVALLSFMLTGLPLVAGANGVDINDTRLLSQPAISKDHVAFIYAGDLWVADLSGKNVKRLTADEGLQSNPAFSPDGSLIAFTAQYDGNPDVYIVPVAGGVPARLTWHPGPDIVQGFTPDGSAVLFTSPRAVFTGRYSQLFTVPIKGGIEEPLKLPNASKAIYSPDGSRLAYNPLSEAFTQWNEYLLAVRGQDLRAPANLYSSFENTSGKIIEITVGPNPDGSGSRTVQVVPIANEAALRNRDWVEGNLKKVDEATGGRVAYVYVPNTTTQGHDYFKRYFYPQSYKEAIIVDERFNGGGQAADYYIDILRRPLASYWAMRYGADLKTPAASIQGPKVMLIDETAGSGGDFLPWMWRKFGLGKLIGKRTWGGLVGILGFPVLMDGGGVTAPNLAIWTPEDGWVVENVGVPPDIEVEQMPADVINGHDPQLEKAIQVVMEELKKNPARQPQRPPYPERNKLQP
jgi:C-terminal processing protease CtpA/Prc